MDTFPRKINMVDLKNQYIHLADEIDKEIQKVIDSCAFINGPAVKEFSKNLSNYLEVKHTIPCANGTDALQVALMALNLQPGDEIITTAFTFVATAEVIALLKLKPVFVDIDPKTFNIDPIKIEAAITPKTKCIIPVHLFGQAADMNSIIEIASKHNLKIIEDNAQSIGAAYKLSDGTVQRLGTIGHIGTTSFYPAKNLGAYGDGGAVFTNDDELATRLECFVNHGQETRYQYAEIGVNSRLDSMQAAVLKVKLNYLDNFIKSRTAAASLYDEYLKDVEEIEIPYRVVNSSHVFHQYTLRCLNSRDELKAYLAKFDIPSMIYYPKPLHLHSAYGKYGYYYGDLPHTELASTQVLSLPMHTELDEEQIKFICNKIIHFYRFN